MSQQIRKNLSKVILEIIQENPEGLSEYEFMKLLKDGDSPLLNRAFEDNHTMFKAHFLLFNILYGLRNELWESQLGHLEISPLKIQLRPYIRAEAALDNVDKLSAYYLDISHMENTTAEEVDELIASFYRHLGGYDRRQWALEQLGLEDPVDDVTIRKKYKRLVMEFHPDRGGDKESIQIINEAAKLLLRS